LKPMLIYKLNMGAVFVKKCGAKDKVKKASTQIGIEVDTLCKDLEDMCHETQQNFAAVSHQFVLMNNNMNIPTSTLLSLHT
jgi:hypothetical protein